MMVNEDTIALRRDVDKLLNKLDEIGNLDNIISIVEARLLERDHDVGSIYFTLIVSDNPNNRFPGTAWVRVEENTYLVSAGDGINALQSIGSNSQSVSIDNSHDHTWRVYVQWSNGPNFSTTRNQEYVFPSSAFLNPSGSIYNGQGGVISSTNTGSSGSVSATQTFDNRPKSIAIYIWRRVA